MGDKHDTTTTGEATLTRAGDATFTGHPKGLFYLAFTEAGTVLLLRNHGAGRAVRDAEIIIGYPGRA